jgi:hypothetical protein
VCPVFIHKQVLEHQEQVNAREPADPNLGPLSLIATGPWIDHPNRGWPPAEVSAQISGDKIRRRSRDSQSGVMLHLLR